MKVNAVLACVLFLLSQNADALPTPWIKPPKNRKYWTVKHALESIPELSHLNYLAERVNLGGSLSDPFLKCTVFAPINDAFDRLLASRNLTLDDLFEDEETLQLALLRHIVDKQALDFRKLKREQGKELETLGNKVSHEFYIVVHVQGFRVIVNRRTYVDGQLFDGNTAMTVGKGIKAGKCIIHMIGDVMLAPET